MSDSPKVTLYHASSDGKGQKQWSIWRNGSTVTVEWGKVGHTLQQSSDSALPKGKVGTKSYMNPEACAIFNYERQIRKKREEGYLESHEAQDERDIFTALDKQFVPAKPRNDMTVEDLTDPTRNIWIQRKRDGQRHLVLITKSGAVRIYSRRMDDMTDHFPNLCSAIAALGLPKKTILDGEIIVDRKDSDDFRAVGTITRSKAGKAAAREQELGNAVRYMVFDCLFFAGKPVWERPYSYRYEEVLLNYIPASGPVYFAPILSLTLKQAMHLAKCEQWEGLVCWFADEPTLVRNGGKPKRCGCAKWKPIQERDVIATGYFFGSGQLSNVVGGFDLAEYDEDGQLVSRGKCGTGMDAQIRQEALSWKYPCVVSIEFDSQDDDSGKFRFPVFLKLHEDKTPKDLL
jgi:ATP-dependent DNA ligase